MCYSVRPKLTELQEELWQTREKLVRTLYAVVLLKATANTAVHHVRALAIQLRLIAIVDIQSALEISRTNFARGGRERKAWGEAQRNPSAGSIQI